MSERTRDVLASAVRHVCPNRVSTFERFGVDVVMGRREGNYFWDLEGREYFDAHINGGTFNLGHRNSEVVETLRLALARYDIGNHHLPSEARAQLAQRLLATAPGDLRYAVFTSSAGEANDVAIRSARRATGRKKIVSVEGAFFGHTGLALAAGDTRVARDFLSEGDQRSFVQVPFNDVDALARVLAPGDVAAVLMETIPATLGFPAPGPGYLAELRRLCDASGTVFVADEVQTGLGRTGTTWAIDGAGVVPDILITGKGLSGGVYPMAAALLSERAGAWLEVDGWGHVSTFGGSELGCQVAMKVLEIVERPDVVRGVHHAAGLLAEGLQQLSRRHPFLREVRQHGLVIGLRFDHPIGGPLVTAAGVERGLWAFFAGFDRSVSQLKPPLLVDAEDCRVLLERLDGAIELAADRASVAEAG